MRLAALAVLPAAAWVAGAAEASTTLHVVQTGETLWSIAARPEHLGDPALWSRIYEYNRDQIPDPDRIYPGQRLRIPRDVGDPEPRGTGQPTDAP